MQIPEYMDYEWAAAALNNHLIGASPLSEATLDQIIETHPELITKLRRAFVTPPVWAMAGLKQMYEIKQKASKPE